MKQQTYCPAFQDPPEPCPLTHEQCGDEHIHHERREDEPETRAATEDWYVMKQSGDTDIVESDTEVIMGWVPRKYSHLIAAAPEMYRALLECRNTLELVPRGRGTKAHRMANDAIASAEETDGR